MAHLDNFTKAKLEYLLGMGGGYVLDFSNDSFAEFVKTAVGFDPYTRYPDAGSKAKTLRAIWNNEPDDVVEKLLLQMLERWRVSSLINGANVGQNDEKIYTELHQTLSNMEMEIVLTESEEKFLEKDLSKVDIQLLPNELTTRDIIAQRLTEIDKCIKADAPLAAILLVGSTLEGILQELAESHTQQFQAAKNAPHSNSRGSLPINQWSLDNLINVTGELGILGRDVQAHATQVRQFRNYIHPARQKKENFQPRIETARIAQQVLKAAIKDLANFTVSKNDAAQIS